MKNKKILEEFYLYMLELFDYWADAKIQDVEESHPALRMESEEYKALQKLLKSKTGKSALKKLLEHHGDCVLHSVLVYIDGGTGVKSMELVSKDTRKPLAQDTLHELWSYPSFLSKKWVDAKDSKRNE